MQITIHLELTSIFTPCSLIKYRGSTQEMNFGAPTSRIRDQRSKHFFSLFWGLLSFYLEFSRGVT